MNVLDNAKLKTKLVGGFLAVAAILVGMAFMASQSMGKLGDNTKAVYHNGLIPIHLLGAAESDLVTIRADVFKTLILPGERADAKDDIDNLTSDLESQIAEFRKTPLTESETAGLAALDRSAKLR